jgi:hypothetical protein
LKEVARWLKPESEATIECLAEKLKIRGGALGVVSRVDELVTPPETSGLTFTQSKGVQNPTEYENEKGEKVKFILEVKGEGLKNFGFEQAGLESTDSLTFEEATEVKA